LQLKERKLKDLEKDYPAYLEQQAELEDPLKRLEVCAKASLSPDTQGNSNSCT